MALPLQHKMEAKPLQDQFIKHMLSHSNDMQIKNQIIALSTNIPITGESSTMSVSTLFKKHHIIQIPRIPPHRGEDTD